MDLPFLEALRRKKQNKWPFDNISAKNSLEDKLNGLAIGARLITFPNPFIHLLSCSARILL